MPTDISDLILRQAISDTYDDAIAYFKLRSESASSSHEKLLATLQAKEFATGKLMLDILIDQDGETFMGPAAANTVIQSLANILEVLDRKQFPLTCWRALDVMMLSQTAPCICEEGFKSEPLPVLH
ncbi:hypothetical protein [Methylobacterium oxalidis]|uniref:Uncharacterized protein n=1 Tax=Methylobacterium oxalidis TaxID=944322 RepID=A0A512J3D5_9HYPH|nr:hypothetical protein [Methylobacterium oxalidis]GEP04475.1 hypothetical protein MOX02_25130 [Methylobacterium oxalidis]GJE30556.1 hypothetical protein LDDCCGHA_0725 [Methylobacterium oxalidis]GLS64754.1 hypothetical protein GCM10007888_31350 [Methylobacterium oxalidis]